jgi:hypothetical protein
MRIVEPSYQILYAPEEACPHCGGELDGAYKRLERIWATWPTVGGRSNRGGCCLTI